MRLRQRPPRALAPDWVQPRAAGRWTTVGNLDSPWRAAVDPAGLVTLGGATWSLDWWVGAEDRWHLPCQEVAVRQSLLRSTPVVETRLRIPSGDAVHRAYAARDAAGAEAIVVEVENASKVPFALAIAVRPHDQRGVGRIEELSLDGTVLRVDGRGAVVLPGAPGRIALSDAAQDTAAVVLAGDAAPLPAAAVRCPDGLAQGALLFPLAHTATLRVVLPFGAPSSGVPSGWPAADQVASGWRRQSAQGTRIEVPDRRLRDAVQASVHHLLLGPDDPSVAAALDLVGFPTDAARRLVDDDLDLARTDRPGCALHAVVRHWELTRDARFAATAVDLVAALLQRVRDVTDPTERAMAAAALGPAEGLLLAIGQRRAAADVRRLAATLPATLTATLAEGAARLEARLADAGSTWTWPGRDGGHDPAANAELVILVRRLLLTESDAGLALSPTVPATWLGQGWELHDAPTCHGRLSFAVRWHGDRPALLWDLERHGADPVRITVPGLDPTWSTTEPRGDALLAPVAIPERAPRRGLSLPVAIDPTPRRPA